MEECYTSAIVRLGADADITVFDPNRVIDKATSEEPLQYSGADISDWRFAGFRQTGKELRRAGTVKA